jgi:hypothetical protein
MLLPSLILATSSIAADSVMLNVEENITNNGTINIGAGKTIKVAEGKWIDNKGVFNLYRSNNADTFNIMGTNGSVANSSGIKNYGTEFSQIDGVPKDDASPVVSNARYYSFQEGPGQMWVINTTTSARTRLSASDYTKLNGGTIIQNPANLYASLKDQELNMNIASGVIVLRGTSDLVVPDGIIDLDHNCEGVEPTTSQHKLNLNVNFANSSKFGTFTKDDVDTEYPNNYGLRVKGYYTFTSNNTEFSGGSVEFAEGESIILDKLAMFPTNTINITGGTMNILNDGSSEDDIINFAKTINVSSHTEGEGNNAQQICGCLKISEESGFNIAQNGVLNLGVELP